METQNLVISYDYSWFLAKNLAYAECLIMKFHYRNSSNIKVEVFLRRSQHLKHSPTWLWHLLSNRYFFQILWPSQNSLAFFHWFYQKSCHELFASIKLFFYLNIISTSVTLIKHVTKFYFGSNLNHLRMIQTLFAKPSLRPSKLPKTASLPNIHQYRDAARIFANGTQDLQVQSSLGFSEPEHQAKSYVPSTIITRCR